MRETGTDRPGWDDIQAALNVRSASASVREVSQAEVAAVRGAAWDLMAPDMLSRIFPLLQAQHGPDSRCGYLSFTMKIRDQQAT